MCLTFFFEACPLIRKLLCDFKDYLIAFLVIYILAALWTGEIARLLSIVVLSDLVARYVKYKKMLCFSSTLNTIGV